MLIQSRLVVSSRILSNHPPPPPHPPLTVCLNNNQHVSLLDFTFFSLCTRLL